MDIYVGNLAPDTTEDDLRRAFQAHGAVASVSLPAAQMKDGHGIGALRGYGFVDMPDPSEARTALSAMKDRELRGRTVTVREAKPEALRRHRR